MSYYVSSRVPGEDLPELKDEDWGTGFGRWSTLGGFRRSVDPNGRRGSAVGVRRGAQTLGPNQVPTGRAVIAAPPGGVPIEAIATPEFDAAAPDASVAPVSSRRDDIVAAHAPAPAPGRSQTLSQESRRGSQSNLSRSNDVNGTERQEGNRERRGRDQETKSWREIVGKSVWEGIEDLNEELEEYPFLTSVEKFTGISKAYLALGTISFLILLVVFGLGTRIISSSVGYLVPLYTTLCIIEDPELPVVKHLLCYWIFYFIFRAIEPVVDQMLSWLPMYYVLKLLFLWWCYSPTYEGASRIYKSGVRASMRKSRDLMKSSFEPAVDSVMYLWLENTARVKAFSQKGIDAVQAQCLKWIEEHEKLQRQDEQLQQRIQ